MYKELEIKIINTIEEFNLYTNIWKQILVENNNTIPFCEPDWINYWWSYFGQGRDLFIIISQRDQDILGFCPLMIKKYRLYYEINFIGYPHACFMDFVIKCEHRHKVIEFITEYIINLKGNFILNLHGMFQDSVNYKILKMHIQKNQKRFLEVCLESRFIELTGNNFSDYFKKRCCHCSIKKIRKNEDRLKELGFLYFNKLSAEKIDEIFLMHDKRWEKKLEGNGFSKGNSKEFFKQLALEENLSFKVCVDSLCLNDKVLSFGYGFLYNNNYSFYRIAHDDDFYIYSPGKIITKEIIQQCFNNGLNIFDFGTGYERYKEEWTDKVSHVSRIFLPSNSIISNLIYAKEQIKENIRNLLKKNPSIVFFKKYTVGKILYLFSMDNLVSMIRRIFYIVKQRGIKYFILNHVPHIFKNIYSCTSYIVFEKSFEDNIPDESIPFVLKEASVEDLHPLSRAMNIDCCKILERFYKKHKCFIVEYENEVIHYSWINFHSIDINDINYNVQLQKNNAFIYDCYTNSEYLDTIKSSSLLSSILNRLYKSSCRKCYIAADKNDKSSLSSIYKAGFKIKSQIKMIKFLYRSNFTINQL